MESKTYLPEKLKDTPFWKDSCVIIDYLLEKENLEIGYLKNKYNSLVSFDRENLEYVVDEFGYDYIKDILNLSDDELKVVCNYINLVHLLKGTRSGLELVFDLLKLEVVDMKEWWETDPQGDPLAFGLLILDATETNKVHERIQSRISDFIKNYVYPKLTNYEIRFKYTLADMQIVLAGMYDQDFIIPIEEKYKLILTHGGFYDQDFICNIYHE